MIEDIDKILTEEYYGIRGFISMIEEGNFAGGETEAFRDEMKRRADSLRTFDGRVMHEVSPLAAYAHKLYADGMYGISMIGSEQLRRDEAVATSGRPESEEEKSVTTERLALEVGKYILGNTLLTVHEALRTGSFDGNAFRERHNFGITATHVDALRIDQQRLSIANFPLTLWQRHDLEGVAKADPTLALAVDQGVFPEGFKKWMETTVVTAQVEEIDGERITQVKTVKDVIRLQLPEYKRQAGVLTSCGATTHSLEEMRMRHMVDDDSSMDVERQLPEVTEVEVFGPTDRAALAAFLQQQSS